jgi:hypothetical protein
MSKLIAAIKKWYGELPKWAQGLVTAAEAGAGGFVIQWLMTAQTPCFNKQCLQQFAGALLAAVIMSVRNWLKQSPLAAAQQ